MAWTNYGDFINWRCLSTGFRGLVDRRERGNQRILADPRQIQLPQSRIWKNSRIASGAGRGCSATSGLQAWALYDEGRLYAST